MALKMGQRAEQLRQGSLLLSGLQGRSGPAPFHATPGCAPGKNQDATEVLRKVLGQGWPPGRTTRAFPRGPTSLMFLWLPS